MPARRDLDPLEMVPWLPRTMLVDVSSAPFDLRFRLVGTGLVNSYGREITGRRLRDLDLGGREEKIFREYAECVETRAPSYCIDEFDLASGRHLYFERLLMPLSDDGIAINMLFGVQYSTADGHAGNGVRTL